MALDKYLLPLYSLFVMATNVDKKRLGVGTITLNRNAKRNVKRVLETRRLSYGPFCQEFERRFSKAHGTRFGVMMNSGTSALQAAVACLAETGGWKPGDEIIVPALTFIATSNVVIQQGLKPIFVDIDPKTYNIDPGRIERAITKRTRAIIPVHLFGQPADMDPIMKIARDYKIKIIEDSCETMFTTYKGKNAGSFGDIACFSTYAAHLIVTGVGGIAVTNSPRYAKILRSLANHGRDGIYISIDDAKRIKGKKFKQIISRRFRFVRVGYSYRVTEFEGAVGCAQLDIAKSGILKQRKRNARYILKKLKPLETRLQLPWTLPGCGHAFMMFPIVIRKDAGVKKNELVQYLERCGIETRDMLPLTNQPVYKKLLRLDERRYPVTKWINEKGFYIGCHQDMRKAELDYIVKMLYRYFNQS